MQIHNISSINFASRAKRKKSPQNPNLQTQNYPTVAQNKISRTTPYSIQELKQEARSTQKIAKNVLIKSNTILQEGEALIPYSRGIRKRAKTIHEKFSLNYSRKMINFEVLRNRGVDSYTSTSGIVSKLKTDTVDTYTLEEYSPSGALLAKTRIEPETVTMIEYLSDGKINFAKFDRETDALEEVGLSAKSSAVGFFAKEYYTYDDNSLLSKYAENFKKRNGVCESADKKLVFLDKKLTTYQENYDSIDGKRISIEKAYTYLGDTINYSEGIEEMIGGNSEIREHFAFCDGKLFEYAKQQLTSAGNTKTNRILMNFQNQKLTQCYYNQVWSNDGMITSQKYFKFHPIFTKCITYQNLSNEQTYNLGIV